MLSRDIALLIIIFSQLISSLLGHRPSLWITHKEKVPYPTTRAHYGWVDANATGANSLTWLPKHGEPRDNKFLVTHPMTDQRCSTIARRRALTWLIINFYIMSSFPKEAPTAINKIHLLQLISYVISVQDIQDISLPVISHDINTPHSQIY
jgi:hypothetical protein